MTVFDLAKQHGVLLVAHRGVCGGNIPCNSLPAFQIALNQGADIIELDVERSCDGELFVQHPGMEHLHLRMRDWIDHYPADFIRQLPLSNCDLARTQWCIPTLRETLEMLKGKCLINIDKFWDNPEAIAKLVRQLGMQEQVIVKTDSRPETLDKVERYAYDMPFIAVVHEDDTMHEQRMKRNIRYIGAEVIFKEETSPVAQKDYIDRLHADGKLLWVNALVYDYRAVLSAGHNDDISMIEGPDKGWGWLADRGFDIIQTDFLLACKLYLQEKGYRPL